MTDYIEINVAKDGRHFFATAERSIHTYPLDHYEEVLRTFEEKFPESEGYKITAVRWKSRGEHIYGF
jgi:hypothetical protein